MLDLHQNRGSLTGFSHEPRNSGKVEWFTPRWVFDDLGLEFELDVAAPPGGVPWVPAKRFLTAADNALTLPWEGRVWCNPPYGRLTSPFLARMHAHRNGIALVFSRTDTVWFHKYVSQADAVYFLPKRISFVNGQTGRDERGAGAGSLLAAWGSECCNAIRRMHRLKGGWLVKTGARE